MYSFWALYIVKDEKAHYLELDDATEISYEWLSPMWNTETSTTWDFSLPRTPYNEELLLPSSANGELIPLNEGRLQGYLTGLPWQDTDEAYWGLLTVISANERRIKVQFLQKSLFEQKLERPVREINVPFKEHKTDPQKTQFIRHRVADMETIWASRAPWYDGAPRKKAFIAWDAATLLKQYAEELGYETDWDFQKETHIYIISNLYNLFHQTAYYNFSQGYRTHNPQGLDSHIKRPYEYKYFGFFVSNERLSLQSSRIALGIVRELLAMFCAKVLVKEYVLESSKKPSAIYQGDDMSTARHSFGELSSYEWVKAQYPRLQDVEVRSDNGYKQELRYSLIPIVAYEEGKGLASRQYPNYRKENQFCFYNDVIDGESYEYTGPCQGREFYVPFPEQKDHPLCFAYFTLKDYSNESRLCVNSHLCDCTPSGIGVSSSQYRADKAKGVWQYVGEYDLRALPKVHGRGAQVVDIPFARGRFVAISFSKKPVYTHGDTLLNSCIEIKKGNSIFYEYDSYNCDASKLSPQMWGHGKAVKYGDESADRTLPETYFVNKQSTKLAMKLLHYDPDKNPDLPNPKDPGILPFPPGFNPDDDSDRPRRPGKKTFELFSLGVSGLRRENSNPQSVSATFEDKKPTMHFKQNLFFAYSRFMLNTSVLRPCFELERDEPGKARAERLFIVGDGADQIVEIKKHDNSNVLPDEVIDNPLSFEDMFSNDLPINMLVLPYFQHLWHAVEGELTRWEEEEVFKYMTEFNYPSLNDTAHIGNQRIKRVTMVLRRNECRIKSVRVIQFNRVATKDEFNKFLQ